MKKALGGLLAGAMLLGGLTLPANAAEATGALPKGQDAETVLSTLTVEPQGTSTGRRCRWEANPRTRSSRPTGVWRTG
ncbi:hypothetical protein [uncultured Bifidobacterium sp.]|uniref:hypothetical protein n=1 Tax=uncultured Bifidobacterium sp. TaxID=165187 RepID=UPI0025981720|nr:hypothetical protein [uncultured Bifidobacterium sp.]